MAYQDIKRALTRLSHPFGEHMDQEHQKYCFDQLYEAYNQLSQEVITCHNHIQQFSVAIANGLTTKAVTFPIPTFTTGYIALVSPEFDAGSWWITGKTTTGCTVNWKTASVGAQTIRMLIVE